MGLPTEAQTLDFTALAQPLGEADACGQNLEYDPQFLELEEEALGKPEVQYGDTITQAVEPNWKRVMVLAQPLLERSRDLRLAIWLTRAQLNLNGIAGLAAGLELVQALLEHCWDGLHPQLDPDDDNDPLLRINILAFLCEPAGVLRDVLDAPLVSARNLGAVTLRQFELASGEQSGEGENVSLAMIEGAFIEADPLELAATDAALTQALDLSVRIEQLLTEKVGVGRAIDLSGLATVLRRAGDVIRRRLPGEAPVDVAAVAAPVATAAAAAAPQALRGEINSREDARQTIDRLCTYFQTFEPASPVPILLQRAKKLIDKNFMELLQDLAPDGLAQLALVSGIRNSDD
ncbi:type VI secretion system protein TssA [Pseudomonas tolaasii]|uniref:type VI secretion system protein TssA n=1 Tax=Pseudomonas tolaasii TaxID=29442 RepID=UPI0015A28F8C|nr:type VI secretion system protein TssA [Pseudomonas tolaasii]NWC29019.1 type VI secretion system protein TssA [Pseudomonas tolaasii]NWC50881.1 type VI secretion system protein TssA [Pseudomonas tolaasii]NWE64484.1 type VI secretion system protein TssA [Pseudomonas tolaasii]WLH49899.1 type VI secretion system protein TssA [Pseudomonas tolaasii]